MENINFVVFGKEGCSYCEQRIEFLDKFIKFNKDLANFSLSYKCVDEAEGLSELMLLDNVNQEEIPIVVMYVNGIIEKTWQGFGAENVPTTRKLLNILEEIL